MALQSRIAPCLWFDSQAEEAAQLYTSVFPNSKVLRVTHYPNAGQETHGREPGSVMTVDFELDGTRFTALNGGPEFTFSEAISFEVTCEDQAEVDRYWNALAADPSQGECGWLKDRFGLSWQIVPRQLNEYIAEKSPASERVMEAMLKMKKIDLAEIERAYRG